jgi:voltage-gated potassium channel
VTGGGCVTAGPPPLEGRRRLIIVGMIRALAVTTGLILLYFVLPLDHLGDVPFWLILTAGVVALAVVVAHQVRAIIRSTHPAVRAIESVAVTVPLFIILFAATYFVLSRTDPGNFNTANLTRLDAFYFTVTVFATVGFGDITATSQTGRVLVTVQMILDLIILGAVVRVFVGAVQFARQSPARHGTSPAPAPPRDERGDPGS